MTAAEVLHSYDLSREIAGDLNPYIAKTAASTLGEVVAALDQLSRDIECRIGTGEAGVYSFVESWPRVLESLGSALRYEADQLAVAQAPQAGA